MNVKCNFFMVTAVLCLEFSSAVIVYPTIVQGRGDGGEKKLLIDLHHSLDMEAVTILGGSYLRTIPQNGAFITAMFDSSEVQRNMFQCRRNMATYTIDEKPGGGIHVEGIVNSTHGIKPLRQQTKVLTRAPHMLFRITSTDDDHAYSLITGADYLSNRALQVDGKKAERFRNNEQELHPSPIRHIESRANKLPGTRRTPVKKVVPRNQRFEIEVHVLLDKVFVETFESTSKMMHYIVALMNIAKLKIETIKVVNMTLRLSSVQYMTTKEMENGVIFAKNGILDIKKTLDAFANHTKTNQLLKQADLGILLTGRLAEMYINGKAAPVSGFAFHETVCHQQYKVGVVVDHGGVFYASSFLAHEMGHILGAPHDGPENTKYSCPMGRHIMTPFATTTSAHSFSNCSQKSIRDKLEAMSDKQYLKCINVTRPDRDMLGYDKHLVPPTLTAEQYYKASEGKNHYFGDLYGCIIHCYHGWWMNYYVGAKYYAPYGFRCGQGKMCLFGNCVPCEQYYRSRHACRGYRW